MINIKSVTENIHNLIGNTSEKVKGVADTVVSRARMIFNKIIGLLSKNFFYTRTEATTQNCAAEKEGVPSKDQGFMQWLRERSLSTFVDKLQTDIEIQRAEGVCNVGLQDRQHQVPCYEITKKLTAKNVVSQAVTLLKERLYKEEYQIEIEERSPVKSPPRENDIITASMKVRPSALDRVNVTPIKMTIKVTGNMLNVSYEIDE